MKKSSKLKLCNRALLIAAPLMLASSIQLEATGSRETTAVWLHLLVGTVFFALAGWHLYLHFGRQNWLKRFRTLKSRVTKILTILALLTLVSGVATAAHWAGTFTHSGIGALHGKIGFLMLALAIGHTIKRFRFFKQRF